MKHLVIVLCMAFCFGCATAQTKPVSLEPTTATETKAQEKKKDFMKNFLVDGVITSILQFGLGW